MRDLNKKVLLTPETTAMIFIDHEPQMFFGVQSMDTQLLKNNVVALAKTAKIFNVPVIYSTIDAAEFSGYIIKELQDVFPEIKPIDRSYINAWEDQKFLKAVKDIGRQRLIMCALWTELCLCMPVLSALHDKYDVYFVVDASGGASKVAHDMAVERMIQAGAIPVTWQQVMLEYQRDWAREKTARQVLDLARQHSGSYGIGIEYADTMLSTKDATQKLVRKELTARDTTHEVKIKYK